MDTICNASQTIAERLLANVGKVPASPFLRLLWPQGRVEQYSYDQLIQQAGPWARFYQMRGLALGQRVVVILPHSLELYAAYLGAVLGGFVPAMFAFPSQKLSPEAYFKTVGQLIRSADARLIVTYPQLQMDLAEVLAKDGLAVPICTAGDVDTREPFLPIAPPADPDAMAFLQYSSGTTGLKKGVGITHRCLIWQVDNYARAIGLSGKDHIVSWLPLYHDMGLIACFWQPLLTGVPVTAMSPLDWVRQPGMLLEAVTRYRPTLCWLPNFAYNHLARSVPDRDLPKYQLGSLRGLINCSEPIMLASHHAFLHRFGPRGLRKEALWTCYAMAENTFAVTSGGGNQPAMIDWIDIKESSRKAMAIPSTPEAPGSGALVGSGRPIPQTKVRVVDFTGTEVPERKLGEIVIQSPCLMSGYFGNPQATEEAMEDGWHHTGDLGYRVGEELFVTARKKDLIIIGGKNIYPQDIEAIVNDVPGVIPGRCVALGIDELSLGTQCLIVLAETHETDAARQKQMREEIIARISGGTEVAPFDVRIVGHMWLAKSSSGKIARLPNEQRYLALVEATRHPAPASPAASANEDEFTRRVRKVLSGVLSAAHAESAGTLLHHQKLISSGIIDSLGTVGLMLAVETEFGIVIPSDAQLMLENFDSIQGIAQLVRKVQAGAGADPARTQAVAEGIAAMPSEMSVRDRKCLDFLAGPRAFDTFILGSSRVQSLSAKLAGTFGCQAYNFAVNSAMAEDWYCMFRFILANNRKVLRRILLGIDIESFSNTLDIDRRLLESQYLSQYLDADDRKGIDPDEILANVAKENRSRFKAILLRLRSQKADQTHEFGYDPITGDLVYLDQDPLSIAHNARRPMHIADPAKSNPEYRLRMGGFTQLSQDRLQYFIRMVRPCVENGVRVTCFLTPIHPVLEEFLVKETTYRARMEELKAGLAHNNTPLFEVLDCSTPAKFAGLDEDFRDPAHIGGHNSDLLLKYLLNPERQ